MNMETITQLPTYVILAAIIGSPLTLALLTFILTKKRYAVDVRIKETEAVTAASKSFLSETEISGEVIAKLKSLIKERLDEAKENFALSIELEANKKVTEIADGHNAALTKMMKDILIEQGRQKEREDRCQKELNEIKERINATEGVRRINKQLLKDNLELGGFIDEQQRKRGGNADENISG